MSVEEKVLDQTQFDSTLKEAEIYYSQGLYEEAKKAYDSLLNVLNQMPSTKEVESQKNILKREIAKIENILFKEKAETLEEETVENIYKKALAFKYTGSYRDAIREFNKINLLKKNKKDKSINIEDFVNNVIECYEGEGEKLECIKYLERLSKSSIFASEELDFINYKIALLYEGIGGYKNSLNYLKKIKNKSLFPNISKKIISLQLKLKGVTKFDYLLRQGIINKETLKKAAIIAQKEKKSIEHVLINKYKVAKKEIGRSLSLYYECKFYDFNPNIKIPEELIEGLKPAFLKSNFWVPIGEEKGKVIVLIDNPYDISRTDIIKKFFKNIVFGVAIREDIIKFIDHFQQEIKHKDSSIESLVKEFHEQASDEEELEEKDYEVAITDSKVSMFVNNMIMDARKRKASDIHIEPCPGDKTYIRFRIDGICHPYVSIPNKFARQVVSRIKVMSRLDIAERRLPQDGKIKFIKDGELLLELRVATLPTVGGFEDVVLRLLHSGSPLKLEELGMPEENLKRFRNIITKPYGLVLVVGPTGSGKTTTLHSVLSYINTPEKKIWTAEDPVEITQKGLRQIEVNPKIGLTFARIMRSFLRADPDVIMIGEMRDQETASTAIEASLTGHLVFSTLHTNTAPETITRLLDMGLDPHNFADSLLAILAQRLVRKLCTHCKQEYQPTQEEFEEIVEEYGKDWFEQRFNITYGHDLVFYKPKGCDFCGGTGYRGRIGIYELLINDDDIKRLIKKRAPTAEIRDLAISKGMATLKQDGILKVFQGITDLREVRRVCME